MPFKSVKEAPKRVLIVDDDASVRLMLGRVLMDEGYAVKTVANGADALILVRTEPFDLVLLDLGLPPTNGWDVFAGLRAEHPALPVVIITARFGEAGGGPGGPDALFEKPLDYPTLLRTLARILGIPAHRPAPAPVPSPLPLHAKRDQA